MFIGGIVGIINALKVTPVEAMPIAINLLKIVSASFVGVVSGCFLLVPGISLLES